VDIHETCRSAIEEIAVNWPTRTIDFQGAGEGEGHWDPDRIVQIITNLVTNALSYGDPSGIVTVRSSVRAERVTLEVHNFGPVIPEQVRGRLFEPFTRQDNRRDPERGIGLGLFIVQEIVRAHGGTVRLESDEQLGTMFTIDLPRSVGSSVAPG
jgi:signal transduction histidine kinase